MDVSFCVTKVLLCSTSRQHVLIFLCWKCPHRTDIHEALWSKSMVLQLINRLKKNFSTFDKVAQNVDETLSNLQYISPA